MRAAGWSRRRSALSVERSAWPSSTDTLRCWQRGCEQGVVQGAEGGGRAEVACVLQGVAAEALSPGLEGVFAFVEGAPDGAFFAGGAGAEGEGWGQGDCVVEVGGGEFEGYEG